MRRALIDLNVVLDVLMDREPHAEASAALWAHIESGEAEGLLAAHSVPTLYYLASKARGRPFAERCVADVLGVFGVAPVGRDVVREALALGWADFEDAVCATAGAAAGCQVIATRDPKGFHRAPLPALTPAAALVALKIPAR
ncbi:MAG: PIN domain-containing protein [Myxococcota bacterium]